MVCVFASVNLSLHHKVQKFSSGTGSPGWSQKKGRKTVVVVVHLLVKCTRRCCNDICQMVPLYAFVEFEVLSAFLLTVSKRYCSCCRDSVWCGELPALIRCGYVELIRCARLVRKDRCWMKPKISTSHYRLWAMSSLHWQMDRWLSATVVLTAFIVSCDIISAMMNDLLCHSAFFAHGSGCVVFCILMSMSVCGSVCLYARISPEPRAWSLLNFVCMLPVYVAQSSSDMLTIGCIAYRREGVFFPIDNAYISATTHAIFTNFFMLVACVRGLVLLQHVYDRLHCISPGRGFSSSLTMHYRPGKGEMGVHSAGKVCYLRLPCVICHAAGFHSVPWQQADTHPAGESWR